MREKGQTSVEYVLVAAIVITIATPFAITFNTESMFTIADSTVRSSVDKYLAYLRFDDPDNCGSAELDEIRPTVPADGTRRYMVYFKPADSCSLGRYRDGIHEDIRGAFGCLGDPCNGWNYEICDYTGCVP
jgi:hypothetical protein